jgi:hypothetical protein
VTKAEAEQVAAICSTADGNCGPCVRELCEKLQKAFPAFKWAFKGHPWPDTEDPEIVVTEK